MMEIEAMSLLYKRDFVIFFGGHTTELKKKIVINNGFNKYIYLCHTPPRHYETVYKNQIMATAAFCQSIVYKILYQNVFKMPDIETTVEKMLHDDASYEDKASCTELSIPPIPYRVAKALDPNIYRNTDFDIWYELRSQVRTTGLLRWNNYRLQVGGKCFVKISQEDLSRQHGYNNHNNSNKYNNNLRMMNRGEPLIFFGHIQEMAPNKGPAVVFIEDLGENRTNTQPQTPPKVPAENHKQNFNSVPETRDFEKTNGAEDGKKFVEDKSFDTCEVQEKKEIQSNGPNPPSNFPGELILCNDMNCIQSSNEACFNLPNPYCDERNVGESHSFPPAGFINYSSQVVNFRVAPSLDINGNDLPYSDISTLRYFFNLGLEYFNMNHVWWPQNEITYPAAPPNTPLSPPPSPPRSLNIIPPENPPVPVVDQCYAPLPPPVSEIIPQRYDNSDYHKNYSPTNRPKQQQQQRYTSPGFNDNPNENSPFQMKMPSKKKSPTNNKFTSKSKNEQDQKSYNPPQEENHFKRYDKKIIHDNQKKNQSTVPEMHNQSPSHCAVPQQMNYASGPYYLNESENNVSVNVYGSPPPGPPGNVYPIPYIPHAGDVPAEVNNFSAPMMFTNPGNYPPSLPPMYPPVMYPPPPLMPHMTHMFNGLPGPNSPVDWCVSPGGQPGCIPYPYPPSQSNEPAS
ncbi:Similar to ALG13: Putative bifunctional UDP-N-acetylglucosamine transferase and deubiquitinase ALG13 (Homo sapiens) [Cotesia congregata]|uniref:Similar to ALG13: Putative bifunctional UDP-N-acetylglucosamine transferase and deubiquitinase ALG13 (Homo sapiens) n=1 Tax=Cotesia congregata TaxID=51543 RepID=A0A8J2HF90_COTCN|nr:Similar to ALG13: Putative bifunctional UDP-N-acetylglucosamine transferase and deubiquitinase ALG13 (Homo sapiens) [Cotesia congregata]